MWCVPPPFSLVNDNLVALEPNNVDLRDALNSCASMQVNASDPMAGFGQKSLQVDVPMAEKTVVSPAGRGCGAFSVGAENCSSFSAAIAPLGATGDAVVSSVEQRNLLLSLPRQQRWVWMLLHMKSWRRFLLRLEGCS